MKRDDTETLWSKVKQLQQDAFVVVDFLKLLAFDIKIPGNQLKNNYLVQKRDSQILQGVCEYYFFIISTQE